MYVYIRKHKSAGKLIFLSLYLQFRVLVVTNNSSNICLKNPKTIVT